MLSITQLLLSVLASLIIFVLWKCLRLISRTGGSPLRHLQGPKPSSFIFGNMLEMINDEDGALAGKWTEEYGKSWRFKFFYMDQLFTMDTHAVNHVLTHSNDYQKPFAIRKGLAEIFSEGLFLAEGARHRQQRRIMNPAFAPAQIRELTDTFLSKAIHLRDLWTNDILKDSTTTTAGSRVDIVPWMNSLTLDIIGLTGFDYNFNALDATGHTDELGGAFSAMFSASENLAILDIIFRVLVPVLRIIPSSHIRKIRAAKHSMMQIGKELLANAKAAALSTETGKGMISGNSLHGRDLLSLLVKANMAADVSESRKLSDEDVIAQVPTFFLAGHETTSTTATWALYAMTQAPEVQTKLRDELLSVDTDMPSMDQLMALPYLDAVVRETLRVYSAAPVVSRVAMKDDVLPVQTPYVDRYGVVRDFITIAKDDQISIPIQAINRSKELWGPDAHEFRPERWSNIPEAVSCIPGIWAHMLTFGGGPRGCIGYRFALVEFKAILFTLLRAFEFELVVPASEVASRVTITRRPYLRSDSTRRVQLPLLIRPYRRM